MHKTQPNLIYLKDYTPPHFLIDSIFLHFDLGEERTLVKSILCIRRNPAHKEQSQPLKLNGEEMILKTILLDGKKLASDRYQVDDQFLTIADVPDSFTLETETEINPQQNTKLSGLYKTSGNYCTQCESHGFRRITYYLDRPDVMARFTTTISADKTQYPLLLSNGNLVDQKDIGNNRHWVKWEDPTLKPCYLFALVAGDLDYIEDHFVTLQGRHVKLFVYVEKGKVDQASFAMQSLKRAMRWDEEKFGREYELDIYMIVAVGDFNFGAMENKGLNIFNDKYILAKPETATDDDYLNIEEVIGHEYFHNWSGNRVTVRDWFQITLKEGLTVFRDQSFSADMNAGAVKRIQDVRVIRNMQFAQDAGPMAHPIRPPFYIEVNNFYTTTVYQKGAEVIRMIQTLLGEKIFRKAMDLYFSANDGFAVTTDDFIKAMEDASGIDLTQFRRWYDQAGTPILTVKDEYDAQSQIYTLTITQSCLPTPGQPVKKEFHIPLAMGLLDDTGKSLPLQLQDETSPADSTTRVLSIKKHSEVFHFIHIPQKPIPSLLRHFSAPVKLHYPYSDDDLMFLMSHDTDEFNQWEAGQQLASNILLKMIANRQANKPYTIDSRIIEAFKKVYCNEKLDAAFRAEMLVLPSEYYLIELMDVADVDAIHHAREYFKSTLAQAMQDQFSDFYLKHQQNKQYELDAKSVGERRLKNLSLSYLTQLNKKNFYQLALKQYQQANNMTDTMGALAALNNVECHEREDAFKDYHEKWHKDGLLLDKWFSLQAFSGLPGALQRVKQLMHDPLFDIKNPNRVRSLIGAFCSANHSQFHDITGVGYEFLTEQVLKINATNPQLASRILEPLICWKKFDAKRGSLMKKQLEKIAAAPKLSKDVYEIVNKGLIE